MRIRTSAFGFIGILVVFLCFIAAEAVAQSTPVKGGGIVVGLNTDITAVDPHTTVAVVDANVLGHVFEPLLAYTENLDIHPVAAESWEVSPDYKTYTFRLIKGKTFHNGREMTAEDVKYSIERIANPATKSPRASAFKVVDRIEVKDKYTVAIHLKEPTATFPYSLADLNPVIAIVPKEEIEKQGGVFKHPIGTGPFKFVEWVPDRYVILERYDNYKGPKGSRDGLAGERMAYLDRIKFVPVPEESVSIMALLNKEIDYLQYFPPTQVEKYRNDYSKKGLVLDEVTGLSWYQIYFGVTKPVTDNVKFRQACAYAIDLDVVTQTAYSGHAKVNPSVIPPQSRFWTDYHKTWYKKDIEKAKQLLKEAGYNGEEVVLDTTKKYISMYRQAVAVQSELAAAGVNVKLNVLEWPVLIKKCTEGDFQMLSYGAGAMPNAAQAYSYLKRNKFDQVFPKIKEIWTAAESTTDLKTLQGLFAEAHKIQYEQVPWIELYNYNYLQAYWNYVKGYKAINTGVMRFWGVWLDK
jgi:peptide/nickel transport system substrate-binding protein